MPKNLRELPKIRDSLSYLYVERCRIEQSGLAIELFDKDGRTPVPAAALSVLMLGPGTTITHAAVHALAENGCSILWCGEHNVRFYAQGLGETRQAYRLLKQARLVSDQASRLEVAWRMYELRFGYRLEEEKTLNQLRGMEGVRVRDAYAEAAETYGVAWHGRRYDRKKWYKADPINRALSAANACLYGLAHAAIVSAGYSPALGFIHTGKKLSFVFDIADLYKTEISIPLAFQVTAESPKDVSNRVRLACRDTFREKRLLKRIVPDMDALLDVPEEEAAEDAYATDAAKPSPLWEALWAERAEV